MIVSVNPRLLSTEIMETLIDSRRTDTELIGQCSFDRMLYHGQTSSMNELKRLRL